MQNKSLLKSNNILPICFLSTVVLQLIIFGSQLLILKNQGNVEHRMNRFLVQENSGKTFIVNNKEFSPKVQAQAIKYFAQHWLKQQYKFSGKTFDSEGKVVRDSGIKIRNRLQEFVVPINAYKASFALPTEIREHFLIALVQEWLPKDYFASQGTTVDFEIKEMGEPEILDEKAKIWQVEVVAQFNYFSHSRNTHHKKFRRKVLIQQIEIPLEAPSSISSLRQKLSLEWRSKGFMVVGISE